MGLFDTVKLKANALAADAERAGKVTAAQARTVVLQNDIRKAERELGHSAFSLIEGGEIAHPDLEAAAARLRECRQILKDKEAEIAELRHGAETGDAAAPAPAETVADTAAEAPLRGPEAEAPHTAGEADWPVGSAALLCIRPHALQIVAITDSVALPATVNASVWRGATTRVVVSVDGLPDRLIDVDTPGHTSLHVGSRVGLRLPEPAGVLVRTPQ